MSHIMKFDKKNFSHTIANSAATFSEISRQQEAAFRAVTIANRERIEREEKMVAGAEASIAQKELLGQQVEFLQKQNDLLSDNYLKIKENVSSKFS